MADQETFPFHHWAHDPRHGSSFAFGAHVSDRGTVATLEVSGELGMASSERFDAYLRQLLSGAPDHVVIDLRGLSFIDSSGLQLLVRAHDLSQRDGFRLSFLCGTGRTSRALRLARVC
jgi:anti-sigma B factor antagonist